MSSFGLGNLYLCLSILCGSGSQVLFKALFRQTGPLVLSWDFARQLLAAPARLCQVCLAVPLLVGGFVFWVMSLSRLDVSYAYPLACCSTLLVTLCGVLFLGEGPSARMWWGVALITLGAILIAPAG
jgi:drug/metabolite transporter (DMT)-like permease